MVALPEATICACARGSGKKNAKKPKSKLMSSCGYLRLITKSRAAKHHHSRAAGRVCNSCSLQPLAVRFTSSSQQLSERIPTTKSRSHHYRSYLACFRSRQALRKKHDWTQNCTFREPGVCWALRAQSFVAAAVNTLLQIQMPTTRLQHTQSTAPNFT